MVLLGGMNLAHGGAETSVSHVSLIATGGRSSRSGTGEAGGGDGSKIIYSWGEDNGGLEEQHEGQGKAM